MWFSVLSYSLVLWLCCRFRVVISRHASQRESLVTLMLCFLYRCLMCLWVIPCLSSEGDSCEFGSQKYLILCGFGGILSCGTTHTAVVPLDLVKCRMQVCVCAGVTRVCACVRTDPGPPPHQHVEYCVVMHEHVCLCSCVPLVSQNQAIAVSSAQRNTTPSVGLGASWVVVLLTRLSYHSTWWSVAFRFVLTCPSSHYTRWHLW